MTSHCCQACGSTSGIQSHHIIFRSQYGKNKKEERDDPTNQVDLCYKCHKLIHDRLLFVIKGEGGALHFISKSKLAILKLWEIKYNETH